jgi:GGDEF domain-containing protein
MRVEDARILELTWLTELEQRPTKDVGPFASDSPERRLVIHSLAEGFTRTAGHEMDFQAGFNVRQQFEGEQWNSIRNVYLGAPVTLGITHAGAVRRAELEQQLQTGRIREPMGLIWDGRHFRQDTRIALLHITDERPLVVAFLDLNDVRAFNEKGHAIGDAAIRRYLELVADIAADSGEAYRLSGGADEVVLLLPQLDLEQGLETIRMLLGALGREVVEGYSLRAAAGVVVASADDTVDKLKARADHEQGRAKNESRKIEGRPSVLAWPTDGLEVIPIHVDG